MKILHVIDARDGSDLRRLRALAAGLIGADALEICCLGPGAALEHAGVPVYRIDWSRRLDFGGLWKLRQVVVHSGADVIHVWQLSALRALAMAAPDMLSRVILSAELPPPRELGWCDRRLVERVRCGPPVALVSEPDDPRPAIPNDSPRIVCAAPLEREFGVRQAIWAFDFLLLLYPDARLDIIGTGTQIATLQALADGLGSAASVHFHPAMAEVMELADIVWVPSLIDRGAQAALDAMALAKTVVASDVPSLRAIIRNGETGLLATPGDVIALARTTHKLIADPALRERIGHAASAHVRQHFSVGNAAALLREAYRAVAA